MSHRLRADTKHYWKLTKHIFRYGHMDSKDSYNGGHTVNEGAQPWRRSYVHTLGSRVAMCHLAVRGEGFLEIIRFFTWVILNVDESTLLD